MYASSLIGQIRCHLRTGGGRLAAPAGAASLREMLAARLTDPRKRRGSRHSLVSVLVAGVACGYSGPLAIAQAAAGRGQRLLAAHGTRRNPVTGLHEPLSASTLGRLPRLLDADELQAGLSGWAAAAALDPRPATRVAARRASRKDSKQQSRRRRKPRAARALREVRGAGWVRAAPGHPWLGPAVTGDLGHMPARPAVAVDGKERKLAKAARKKKVHLLGAITHVTGLVISQDKLAKAGRANEVSHFQPLLEPLPLEGVLVTAMQTTRDNARFLREAKQAHFLVPVLETSPACTPPSTPWAGSTPPPPPRPSIPPAAGSRPAPSASSRCPPAWTSTAPGRPSSSSATSPSGKRHLGDAQLRGRAVHHQLRRHRHHCRGPARPRLRPLDGGAPALATRRDLERGQIPHPHRKRPAGDVGHHQPRHHPVPATRSNRIRGRNPPQRPGPPPCTPALGPFTRLNTPYDFDESLVWAAGGWPAL